MTKPDSASKDVDLLVELSRVLVGVAVRSLGHVEDKVSLAQFRALVVLERLGPCNAGGLADELGLHTSTVTRLCDRMVAAGYVTRQVRADNRREISLTITRTGQRLVSSVMARRSAELSELLDAVPAAARLQLSRALPHVVAAAESVLDVHISDAALG
jgi:DNA-binding MarR family transcriptional regulator